MSQCVKVPVKGVTGKPRTVIRLGEVIQGVHYH
jgi:hypothetical protein